MRRKRTGSRWFPWLLLAIVLVLGWQYWPRPAGRDAPASDPGTDVPLAIPPREPAPPPASTPVDASALPAALPPEARHTIALIRRGGPFPHRQDGSVFGNREGLLPRQPRGWYREYTVDTPGLTHRGARRIVTGGDPPREWYYSDDHYRSFRAFAPGSPP